MNSDSEKINLRILIVDDNVSIHDDFQKILGNRKTDRCELNSMEAALFGETAAVQEARTFELNSAFQGREALAMVEQSLVDKLPYALAFVDVRMPPGWDGLETVSRIWQVDPSLQVVICTAYADYSWEAMRAKVGQPDNLLILKKPFDNVEVQQLAHALTHKWWLNGRVHRHVEELTKANASVAMSEERFSKAFKESPIPSAIQTYPDQRIVDVNQRFIQVTGCRREELVGHTPGEMFLWETPALAGQWYDALARQQLVREQPAKIRTPAGNFCEVRVSLTPVTFGGEAHVLLLAQDVSEQALLERQLRQAQKMEAIGQLAAGVAHDFNNILTIIQGHAGILQNKHNADTAAIRSVEQISLAAGRAATLTRQLLMFCRKQVMQFRYLDVNEILRNALRLLERLVGEHVEIEFFPEAFSQSIYADGSMLEQIAMNLAVNARDAMPNGGKLVIRTALETIHRAATPMDPENREGEFVCLTFADTGIGMDTQILGRIFEPFFTTKPVGKGTGLGLSTVFGIVRQHHGWLEVESKPKMGSKFLIYLPASAQAPAKTEVVVDAKLRTGSETVLVAEDEEALRQMVVHVLKLQGYHVLEAESGHRALEVWEQANRPVDLLLTDLVMPGGIMGSELAERLTQKCPSLKVIYTSGYSLGLSGTDSPLLAGKNFLPKPYSIGKLAQLVRECLDSPPERLLPKHSTDAA